MDIYWVGLKQNGPREGDPFHVKLVLLLANNLKGDGSHYVAV